MRKVWAAAFFAAVSTAAASAQGAPPATHVRGVVDGLAGNVLTVGAPIGDQQTRVTLAANVRVQYVVKASLAEIKPGSFVGSAAVPQVDGSLRALEVQIFPPGQSVGTGSAPYDLTPTSTMTNGHVETIGSIKVDNADSKTITVTYDGGAKTIVVTPDTPIVTYEPADTSALVKGARVSLTVTKNADGTLSARSVNVGKNGLQPPM